ncbi:unnamed protein product, partial [Nesidiocoris tenuis]
MFRITMADFLQSGPTRSNRSLPKLANIRKPYQNTEGTVNNPTPFHLGTPKK